MKKFKKLFAVITFLMLLSVTSIPKGNVTVPPITKAPGGGVILYSDLPPIDTY
jgi:hypothetical protein